MSLASLAGGLLGGTAEVVGGAYDNLTPGKGSSTLTKAGQAITNPNVVLSSPSGILNSSPAFSYVPPAASGQVLGASTTNPNAVANSGVYTGGTGANGSGGTDYSAQIGSLDAQTNALKGTLGGADTSLAQGLANLQAQYNQQQSDANTNHSRALQDFQTTEQNDNTGHEQAIDQVNTKARTLANSVRQMIGNAAGSGSSAYQITAPDAVQRQADLQSQGINDNFGQNITALTTSKQREGEDYGGLLSKLADTFAQSKNGLQTGIQQQKQQINGTLADLAAQRAAYAGGGVAGAQAAASPYEANVASANQAIQNIASQYQSPFQSVAPVSVAAPTLRDYVTGQTNVATNPAGTQTTDTQTYNPLASWLKQDQNQYAF